jgi:anti-sigma factor RsiW
LSEALVTVVVEAALVALLAFFAQHPEASAFCDVAASSFVFVLVSAVLVTVEVVVVEAFAEDFLCSSHFIPALATATDKPRASTEALIRRNFIWVLLW